MADPAPPHADDLGRHLSSLDPAFATVVAAAGPCPLGRRDHRRSHFAELAKAICHQQLAGPAARTIQRRFEALVGGRPTPAAVLALGEAPLRGAGLSRAKAASLLDLAERASDGRLHLASLGRRTDEEVVAALVQVRGIGRWTAEMFLMFRLGRPDVWPVDDLGVQIGWSEVHGLDERIRPRALLEAGEPLRPIRSAAAWYCWRAVDLARAERRGAVGTP